MHADAAMWLAVIMRVLLRLQPATTSFGTPSSGSSALGLGSALDGLRSVDATLSRCVDFWSSMEVVMDMLVCVRVCVCVCVRAGVWACHVPSLLTCCIVRRTAGSAQGAHRSAAEEQQHRVCG